LDLFLEGPEDDSKEWKYVQVQVSKFINLDLFLEGPEDYSKESKHVALNTITYNELLCFD